MSEKNFSPFHWYAGTYLVGFNLVDQDKQHALHDEYDGWEVSVLVRADTCQQAYDRIVEVAKRDTRHYVGELDGISVDFEYKGIIELDPMYSPVDETADVVYIEHNHTRIKDQKFLVCKKGEYV